jgi:tape measure domain-containing protein
MAGQYDASAKFDSSQAERGINSLAGKIDGLKTKLQGVASAGKAFDSTWGSANRSMSAAATKARSLESSLATVGRGAKSATTAMRGFVGAMGTAQMSQAAGIIRSLGTHLTTTSTRMRQIRGYAAALQTSLAQMGRSAVAGALGIERLGNALQKVIPKMMQGASAGKSLASSLGFLQRSYGLQVTGLGRLSTATKNATGSQSALASSHKSGANAANQYGHALAGVNSSILGLGSGLAGVRNLGIAWLTGKGISEIAQAADTYKQMSARLTLVTTSSQQSAAAQDALFESANRTRTGFADNVSLFVKLAQAGNQYGVSLSKTLQITENFQKALRISGASTGEKQAASQQFGQAFASGRLQGDELKSILENAPRLSKALSDAGFKLATIRQEAKKGAIGIKEMVDAFGNDDLTKKLNAESAKIPMTMSEALVVAGNNVMKFVGQMDSAYGISGKVAGTIVYLSEHLKQIASMAVFAGAMMMAHYVPSLIAAAKETRILVALKWAEYGSGVVGAMKNASSAVGLFKGALQTSTKSTLPAWKQVMGNVVGAVGMNIGTMGKVFSSVFMRLPALMAIGSVALYAWNDDTKIVAGQAATTQDYMATGFEIAWNKILSIVSYISGQVQAAIKDIIDETVWAIDKLYRLAKMGGQAIAEGGKFAKNMVLHPMSGGSFDDGAGDRIKDAGKKGLREDFGDLVAGTEWQKMANARANARNKPPADRGLLDNNPGGHPPPPPPGKEKKAKKDHSAEKLARETKQAAEALNRMMAGFDETEQARSKFNDGLDTLNDAMKYGVIDAKGYKDTLDALAHDTFPGLSDQMKSLQKDNKDLIIRARGGEHVDQAIDVAHATDDTQKQIDQIDAIIKKQGDVNGILEARKTALTGELNDYIQMRQENEDLVKLAADRQKQEEAIKGIIDDTFSSMSDLFSKYTSKMLSFGKFSWKHFFGDILGLARDTLTQIMNVDLFQPMQEGIKNWLTKAITGKRKGSTTPVGSGAVGDAMAGMTGNWKPFAAVMPDIKIDLNGKKTSSKGGGGVINLNVAADKPAGQAGAVDPGSLDPVVVTGHRTQPYGFIQGLVGGYKNSWKDSFKDLGKLFKPLGETFKKVGAKLGINTDKLGKFGETVGKAFGGAQKGAMIAGIGSALGMKTSKTGGMIGGALGSFLPIPGGDIIGGIVGSIVGGLFKRAKHASISVSTGDNGRFTDSKATGNDAGMRDAVTQLAGSVTGSLSDLASQLGGELASNFNLGTIGTKTKKHGGFLGIGSKKTTVYTFGGKEYKTEEEAVAAMVHDALSRGIIKGLSATSDKVLRTFKDIDRAAEIVQTIETVKKQAAQIRNPTKAAFDDLKKDLDGTLKMFKEAGASAEDYADLQVVAQQKFKDIVDQSLDTLKDFRFDLTGGNLSSLTPADRLKAESTKFSGMESDIAAGKAVDPSKFTDEAANLIDLARTVYGSTPEFAEYQARVLKATDAMISATQAQVDAYQPIIDAIIAQSTTANNNAQTTNQLLGDIRNNTGGQWSSGNGIRIRQFNDAGF